MAEANATGRAALWERAAAAQAQSVVADEAEAYADVQAAGSWDQVD